MYNTDSIQQMQQTMTSYFKMGLAATEFWQNMLKTFDMTMQSKPKSEAQKESSGILWPDVFPWMGHVRLLQEMKDLKAELIRSQERIGDLEQRLSQEQEKPLDSFLSQTSSQMSRLFPWMSFTNEG